jgi:ATP-dependent Clp protease ATP-binding subunit ClpA
MTQPASSGPPADTGPDANISPWQRDVLRKAQRLTRRRNHVQITMDHVALVLLDDDDAIVRNWRSLGIDVEKVRRELAPPGLPETSRYGRGFQFHADTPRELLVTREVAEFFEECAGLTIDAGGRPSAPEVANAILTRLDRPLPGSPLLQTPPRQRPHLAPRLPDEDSLTADAVMAAATSVPVISTPAPLDPGDEVALAHFGRDLTQLAAMGRLDALVGRDAEVEAVLRVLRRRAKRNPLLVGEPGVGKTAIVEGVAARLADGVLGDTRLISVDLGGILAGTRYRGEFEERVQELLEEATHSASSTILFIDEFHLVVRTGAAEGGLDIGSILLAPMARGHIAVIGATTPADYHRHLRYAGPLMRRVQVIEVAEPTPAQALEILRGVRGYYAEFHDVTVDDSALATAIALGRRTPGQLPDTALDLLDDACAHARHTAGTGTTVTVTGADVTAIMATRPSARMWAGGPLQRARATATDLRTAFARISRARR